MQEIVDYFMKYQEAPEKERNNTYSDFGHFKSISPEVQIYTQAWKVWDFFKFLVIGQFVENRNDEKLKFKDLGKENFKGQKLRSLTSTY